MVAAPRLLQFPMILQDSGRTVVSLAGNCRWSGRPAEWPTGRSAAAPLPTHPSNPACLWARPTPGNRSGARRPHQRSGRRHPAHQPVGGGGGFGGGGAIKRTRSWSMPAVSALSSIRSKAFWSIFFSFVLAAPWGPRASSASSSVSSWTMSYGSPNSLWICGGARSRWGERFSGGALGSQDMVFCGSSNRGSRIYPLGSRRRPLQSRRTSQHSPQIKIRIPMARMGTYCASLRVPGTACCMALRAFSSLAPADRAHSLLYAPCNDVISPTRDPPCPKRNQAGLLGYEVFL